MAKCDSAKHLGVSVNRRTLQGSFGTRRLICYTKCLGFPDKQNAHFREVSDNSDHGRAACPQRAVDFAQRYVGWLRMPDRCLHVCRTPARFRPGSGVLPGHGRTVRNAISRQLHQRHSQHSYLRTYRTSLVESDRGLEFLLRCLRFKSVALPRADSGSTSSIPSLMVDLRCMIAD